MDEATLQGLIRKYRFHITESLSRSGEFSSRYEAEADRVGFFHALHREYKIAQEIMIAAHLEIEADISSFTVEAEQFKKGHWKTITELCFNTLIWICLRWDRSDIKRVFKGPKHGSSSSRNVAPVLKYIRDVNESWNDFAVALDFCRFECIADVLQVHLTPDCTKIEIMLIEVKEGRVNKEILETIEAGSDERYFAFFDKYGASGIKQMGRYFRQAKKLAQGIEIISSGSGRFDTDEGQLLVQMATEPRLYYNETVKKLLKHLESEPVGHFIVDGCLLVAGIRSDAPERLLAGDFLLRHSIHHTFSSECSLCMEQDDWMSIFREIKILDGLAMFGSVAFEGLISKSIADSDVLDLLFGRIRMFYHLDGDRFVELCQGLGLDAGYLTVKESNRMRSSEFKQGFLLQSRLLWMKRKSDGLVMYLAEGMLHDMCLNWVHPYWWVKQYVDMPSIDSS